MRACGGIGLREWGTHVDALQLEVGVAVVGAGRVNAWGGLGGHILVCSPQESAPGSDCSGMQRGQQLTMLVGDDLPELGADLVAALASLDVDDLAHAACVARCVGDRSRWVCIL